MRKAVATQWVNCAAVENTNGFFHLKPLRAVQLPFSRIKDPIDIHRDTNLYFLLDMSSPAVKPQPENKTTISEAGVRTFLNIADAWKLNIDTQRALLGFPSPSTYFKYKAGQIGPLAHDVLTRISLIIGIYKGLHTLYADEALADSWVNLPNSNSLFGGKPALSLMTEGGIDGLCQTRRLIDSRLGGDSV